MGSNNESQNSEIYEAEAIALALVEKAQFLGIDDNNGIHVCKLLGNAFATAVGILIRSREKGLLAENTLDTHRPSHGRTWADIAIFTHQTLPHLAEIGEPTRN